MDETIFHVIYAIFFPQYKDDGNHKNWSRDSFIMIYVFTTTTLIKYSVPERSN